MTTQSVSKPIKYHRGENPKSLANLKPPWQKGHAPLSDPPEKGFQVSRRLRRMLEELSDFIPPNANPNDKVYAEQIARQIIIKSAQGDTPMTNILLDRTEGKVPDKHEVEVKSISIIEIVLDKD